jgi:hypothetical protein
MGRSKAVIEASPLGAFVYARKVVTTAVLLLGEKDHRQIHVSLSLVRAILC